MFIRTAWKSYAQLFADNGSGSIAAGEIRSRGDFFAAIRISDLHLHPVAGLRKLKELLFSLHRYAELCQMTDQKTFMQVLRKDQCIRERTDSCAHLLEGDVSCLSSPGPDCSLFRPPA